MVGLLAGIGTLTELDMTYQSFMNDGQDHSLTEGQIGFVFYQIDTIIGD